MGMRYRGAFALVFALGVGVVGCSKSDDAPPQTAEDKLRALYSSDLQGLNQIDPGIPAAADAGALNGALTQIFGGTTGKDFQDFFNSRVNATLFGDETVLLEQDPPVEDSHKGWSSAPANPSTPSTPAPISADTTSAGVEVVALNVGFGLWFQSILDSTTTTLLVNGTPYVLSMPHPGIMAFGTGYRTTVKDEQGNVLPLPAAYRQGILMHEARHSDCSGGLTPAEIEAGRTATNIDQFDQEVNNRSCGHIHVKCVGGTYDGVYACDAEPWGAYTVGGLFMISMLNNLQGEDADILKAEAADSLSRVVGYDLDDVLADKYGKPDMSSQGVISP